MNGFDQPIRSRRDDGEGSPLVARFSLPLLVEVGQAEQSFLRADRELDPEEPRPVKKGSVAARVGVRPADCEQGNRSVRAIEEPSRWRTRNERGAKIGRLRYLRTNC
jgi:hypothetical protein